MSSVNSTAALSAWDNRISGSLKAEDKAAADDAKLKKTCQEMEGVFLNMMLKSMRETVPKNSLASKSLQSDTMQSMFDMELTRNLAMGRGTGLAEMMYRNLKNQGTKNPGDKKAQ